MIHLPDQTPILSRPLWDELIDTLKGKFDLDPDELPLLLLYRRHAVWVEPPPLEKSVCRDPDDDWILATTVAGQADAIVTGDGDLLVLGAHQGVAILSPRQLIVRLTTRE